MECIINKEGMKKNSIKSTKYRKGEIRKHQWRIHISVIIINLN